MVPVFWDGDLCDIDGKTHRSTFELMTHAKFVVPVFQRGDLGNINWKTRLFHVRIGGSKGNFELLWFESQFFEKKWLTYANFVVPVFNGVISMI